MGHGCQVPGSGHQVTGIRAISIMHHAYPVCGFFEDKRLVPGSRFRVPGTWDPGPVTESTPRAGHRAPRTELNAHTGYASCILHPCLNTA